MQLAGRVALVTGGSEGIGRAIALAFAREGCAVAVVARTAANVVGVADEVRALGGAACAIVADVGQWSAATRMATEAEAALGPVDTLVTCAGVQGPVGLLAEGDPTAWADAIQINLLGTYHSIRAALPGMQQRGRGSIITLSGGGAVSPRPRLSAYAAAKAGVVRLTETLAEELVGSGIRVNAIAPGACATTMLQDVLAAGAAAGAELLAQTRQLLDSGGTPLEVPAALAVFLAGDESAPLTGRLISAVHDDHRRIAARADSLGDAYTMRRLDSHTLRSLNPAWHLDE